MELLFEVRFQGEWYAATPNPRPGSPFNFLSSFGGTIACAMCGKPLKKKEKKVEGGGGGQDVTIEGRRFSAK